MRKTIAVVVLVANLCGLAVVTSVAPSRYRVLYEKPIIELR